MLAPLPTERSEHATRPLPDPSKHPPRALPPRKARTAAECERLEQLPNIGPSIAADLRIRHAETLCAAHHPAVHHGAGEFGVKL